MNTPRAYELRRDGDSDYRYRLEAHHICTFMGVDCPSCGAWAMTGIQYPSVDPSKLLDDMIPRRHVHGSRASSPMSVETFREVAAKLTPILGPDRPFIPGTELGPLRGKGSGNLPDFAWVDSWTPLVRESTFQAMRDVGIDLIGAPAEIMFRRREPHEALIEIEVRPTARLHPSPPLRICELCGRVPTKRGRKIDGASFDHSIPLQRIREWPTRFLANEAMSQFIEDRGPSGVDLTPIEFA